MLEFNPRHATFLALPIVLGVITVTVAGAIDAIALRLPLQAIAVTAAVVAAWRVAAIATATAGTPAATAAVIESLRGDRDRRRPTLDRETGLLASWYFTLRVDEEIRRATRYGQVFTIVMIAASGSHLQRVAAEAVTGALRATDLAGVTASGVALLLTHTSAAGADIVIERLASLLPGAVIRSAAFPADGTTSGELLGLDAWQTGDLGAHDVVA